MAARRADRQWIAGGIVAALVIAAVGWLFFVSPEMSETSATEQQTANAQTQNGVLRGKIAQLRKESEQSGELQQQLDAARAGLPIEHGLDALTDQLTRQATDAHVLLTSITPGQPTEIIPPKQAAPKPAEPAEGDDADSSTTATPAPEAPQQTGPAGNLYAIAVTVVSTGTMADQRAFLSLVQRGPRLALVTSTAFAAAPEMAPAEAAAHSTPAAGDVPAAGTGSGEPNGTDSGAVGSANTAGAAAAAAAAKQWTMTAQLQIFVAPKAPPKETAPTTADEPAG